MANLRVLLDGKPAHAVPASDRGMQFGDGLFETIRVVQGKAPLWDRHMARLREGANRLGLPLPSDDTLAADCQTIAADHPGIVAKIILTRGDGGSGYRPPGKPVTRRIVMARPLPPVDVSPLTLGVCETRLGHNALLAGLKHLGRLEQVLAQRELAARGLGEGLMLDQDNAVIEATMSNLFVYRDNAFVTPPLDRCGVQGVMRAAIIDMLKAQGSDVRLARVELRDCLVADGLFLCNAVRGVQPVGELNGRHWSQVAAPIKALQTQVMQLLGIMDHQPGAT